MGLLLNHCLVRAPQAFRVRSPIHTQIAVRYASLNSAISKGLRKGGTAVWLQRGRVKKDKGAGSFDRSSNGGQESRFPRKTSSGYDRYQKPGYEGARQGGKRSYDDKGSFVSGDRSPPWQQRGRVNRTEDTESASRFPRKPFSGSDRYQGRGGDRTSGYDGGRNWGRDSEKKGGFNDRDSFSPRNRPPPWQQRDRGSRPEPSESTGRFSRRTSSGPDRFQGREDRTSGYDGARKWNRDFDKRESFNDRDTFGDRPAPWEHSGRVNRTDASESTYRSNRNEFDSSLAQETSSNPDRRRKSADREPMHWRVKSKRKGPKEKPDINDPVSFVTKVLTVAPRSVPYTNPVSEFIYGYSAVRAAVRSGRRQIYCLYIYYPDIDSPKWSEPQVNGLQKFAGAVGAKVKLVSGNWLKILDKMSDGRPHNGFIAEVSPLPKLPALSYDAVPSLPASHFTVNVAPQSKEEADVNGTNGRIPLASRDQDSQTHDTQLQRQHPPRYPFTLLLDGILDPGNLGAIIRSAYFFGVDAIAFSSRNSAPLSPITIKASAGAAENVPLISIHDPPTFIDATRKNGWRFFAAEPPLSTSTSASRGGHTDPMSNIPILSPLALSAELRKTPCVLMLGGEAAGLTKMLKRRADAFVAIPGAQMTDLHDDPAEVDSLNVSVASGLLCEAFLREPSAVATTAAGTSPAPTPAPATSTGTMAVAPAEGEESAVKEDQSLSQDKEPDDERVF